MKDISLAMKVWKDVKYWNLTGHDFVKRAPEGQKVLMVLTAKYILEQSYDTKYGTDAT